MNERTDQAEVTSLPRRWLNRTVVGTGLTSLFADLSYEAAFSVMPGYVKKIGGSAAHLGLMEGLADGLASFVKLGSGIWSDRTARRKPFAAAGYALTAVMPALIALSVTWPLVLFARILGWFGKGLRGPARDALLAGAVPNEHRGKAFGFHRAGDTVGAVLGPLLAAEVLRHAGGSLPERTVMWSAVLPGTLAVLALLVLVREVRGAAVKHYNLGHTIRRLPPNYRRFLFAVGIFGAGDFSHMLLMVAASADLTPQFGLIEAGVLTARLYALRNVAAVLTAFPVGALSDRLGRRRLLIGGYGFAAALMTCCGLLVVFDTAGLIIWAVIFACAGVYIAVEETLEAATAADLVADADLRGTAFGVLGVVNGCGDFVSSVVVGGLSAVAPAWGFGYAAVMMGAGAVFLAADRS